MSTSAPGEIALDGIDGRNPIAFLAALGVVRLAAESRANDLALSWEIREDGVPRPSIHHPALGRDSLVELLVDAHLSRDLQAELGWTPDIMRITREQAREKISSGDTALSHDLTSTLIAELPPRRNGDVPYTPFRLIPRVGRARLLSSAMKVAVNVKPADFEIALFGAWRYRKGFNSLRLDPGARISARAYAAEAPTNFGPLGVPGAIALATVGLSLFPLQPGRHSANCRGFSSDRQHLRWPIWEGGLALAAIRLLLGLPELQVDAPDERLLKRHGVLARIVASRERRGDDDEALSWGTIDVRTDVGAQ